MRNRIDPSDGLRGLAALQGGVVTREQAIAQGLSDSGMRRLVDQGHWRRLAPGLFQTTPGADCFEARAWAGVLAGGSSAMLSEHAAAFQQGLLNRPPDVVAVAVASGVRRAAPEGVVLRRRLHLPRAVGVLPCTVVETTVLDMCAVSPERMVEWVTTALRARLTTPSRLLAELEQRPRITADVRGRLLLLLSDVHGLESPLEHLFVERVLRPHGLPRGERQVRFAGRRHDLRIGPVLVELDGRVGHDLPGDRFRDMDRDNRALVQGLVTLRYGWDDCWHRPCEAARQLESVLVAHGVSVGSHACPSCASARASGWAA